MSDPQQTDPTLWGALGASVTSLGASMLAYFKTRDTDDRIHRANGKSQDAINRVAVAEQAVRDIARRLDRIEDKLDRALEGR